MLTKMKSKMKNNGDQLRQDAASQTLSLTCFLFGNIDASGQLEGDIFDDDVKLHLASLSRLGLGTLLRQVTDESNEEDDSDEDEGDKEQHHEGRIVNILTFCLKI